MKRALVILVFYCLLSAFCFAQRAQFGRSNAFKAVAAAACSTYNTTNAWDNFIEGFNVATTCLESNVWTTNGTTANWTIPADSTALTTYKPAGACNQAVKLVVPTDGTETYLKADLGAAIDVDTIQTDVYFSFYLETAPDVAGETYSIFFCGPQCDGDIYLATDVQIRLFVAQPQIRVTSDDTTTWRNISAGQWYVVKLSFGTSPTAGQSTFTLWSNNTQICSDAFDRQAGDIRCLYLGAPYGLAANESGTIWFDLLTVKTN